MSTQQVVLITGTTSGIGLAIAETLYRAGYRVFGTSRAPANAEPRPFDLVALDVTEPASVTAAVSEVLARAGRIDVLINNVGYDMYGAAEEATPDEVYDQLDANFLGAARLVHAVLPAMRKQGSGKIVNISSLSGIVALPYNSAYAASKFALEGYSESLRLELHKHGIHVSLVQPPGVATDTLSHSIRGAAHENPAYDRARFIDFMRTGSATSRFTPQDVADQVLRVVRSQNPRLRYPIGTLARVMPLLKAIIPQGMLEAQLRKQFGV